MSRTSRPAAPPPASCAVVYTRVSSDAQLDGTSLDTQRDLCERCAERMGLPVLRVLTDEAKSAKSTAGRVALAEAIALCEKHGAALIVYKFDRLARNVGDAYQMRDLLLARGCRIVSATEGEATATPIAKAMYNMMATFAELDNDMRTERTILGLRARAASGGWVAHAPFGYRPCRTADGIPSLEPGEHAETVRDTFRRISDGSLSVPDAVAALRPWLSRHRAYAMLSAPVYCGVVCSGLTDNKPVKGVFDGLVSRAVFDAVQERLAAKSGRKAYTLENVDFPFTRLLPCPVCGKPLRGGWSKGRHGARYGYYFCSGRGHCSIPREDVHGQFRALAVRLSECREFVGFVRDNIAALDPDGDPVALEAVRAARAEVERQERRMANLRTALLDGAFTGEEYEREKGAIEIRLADARGIIAAHDGMAARRERAVDALCGVVASAGDVFDRLPPRDIKDFVRIVFGSVRIVDADGRKRIEPPQDSVYQVLTAATDAKSESGEGLLRLFETAVLSLDGLMRIAAATVA